MIKTIKVLLLTILCSTAYSVRAEQSPIAYVKLNYIIESLPETKQAEEEIKAFEARLRNQLQSKATVFQEEMEALNKSGATMTEEAKKKKEANIARLYTDFQNFQQECQNLTANKVAELRSPITEKVKQKIQEVAKEKGYAIVLNYGFTNDDDLGLMVVYGKADLDITNIVLKKLGIDTNKRKANAVSNDVNKKQKTGEKLDNKDKK